MRTYTAGHTAKGLQIAGAFTLMLAGAAAAVALPADLVIGQKGHVFSVPTLTVKKGETVRFLNDDTVPHNIMSMTDGNEFNLGSQRPGMVVPVSFDRSGIIAIICAIHPRMKMTITVHD